MIALARYQLSLLLRSHRWIPPAVLFVAAVVGLGGATLPHGAGLSQGLAWSALMLVPVEAWLTRTMLTAEPPAARACVAAAGGPRRAQLAAPIAAAAVGIVLGLLGVEHTWPAGIAVVTALALAVAAWVISAQVAARRDG